MSTSFTPAPLERALVGFLLAIANSNPPFFAKGDFYELKTRLCESYGRLVGYEWQHVKKECYKCDGTGKYMGVSRCWSCGGSGVYSNAWHKLEIWQVDAHRFHRPILTRFSPPNEPVTIEGIIKKEGCEKAACEAYLWLCLIFNPPLWLKLMFRGGRYCYPNFWPMLCLQWLAAELRDIAYRFRIHRCFHCDREFVRFSRGLIGGYCPTCFRVAENFDTEVVPF